MQREHHNSDSSSSVSNSQLLFDLFIQYLLPYFIPSNNSCNIFLWLVLSDTYSLFTHLREMKVMDEVEVEKSLCKTENLNF